jgi:hypothetical protein
MARRARIWKPKFVSWYRTIGSDLSLLSVGALHQFDEWWRGAGSVRILLAIVLLLVALMCVYGVIASTEPTPNRIYFLVGYAVAGILSCLGVWRLLSRRKPADEVPEPTEL